MGGTLLWVSEMQTTFMGVALGGGRYGKPRRVMRTLCKQVRSVVRGLWSRVYRSEGGSKGELGGRRNPGRRPIFALLQTYGLVVGSLDCQLCMAAFSIDYWVRHKKRCRCMSARTLAHRGEREHPPDSMFRYIYENLVSQREEGARDAVWDFPSDV